jgi:protein SCO1/2
MLRTFLHRFGFGILLLAATNLSAYDPNRTILKDNKLPRELEGIGAQDRLGGQVRKDLRFVDSTGAVVTLGDLLAAGKPILISPVYYKCPSLCNYHMNGILQVLKNLDWNVGDKFQYLAFSIDPREKPGLASEKKNAYLQEYSREGSESGFHLWTGDQDEISAFTEDLGFRYSWDKESSQYIHSSVAYVITPDGKISRILQGISFDARDLKLAFLEASRGKIGDFIDNFALFCFQFDPSKNKYTLYAYNIMRLGAIVTLILVGGFLSLFWFKNMKVNDRGVA